MSNNNAGVIAHSIRRGREFIQYADGTHLTRRVDEENQPREPWRPIEPTIWPPHEEPTNTIHLSVIAEHQAEGEPKHWSLLAHWPISHSSGLEKHQVWQVTGDAESMRYEPRADVDKLRSGDLAWTRTVNVGVTGDQFLMIESICRQEPPPHAENRASVRENCQGWVIRVLQRLVAEGIVEETLVSSLREHMDPI